MAIKFITEGHKYESLDSSDANINWISVTSFVKLFKPEFNREAQAIKSSKNKNSKWYGMKPEDILVKWEEESQRAQDLGTWYHNQRELDLIACDRVRVDGCDLQIFRKIEDNGVKIAPDQNLVDGIYPEHMIYLKSAGLCGQADRVDVVRGTINIDDYKTNKEIKFKGFTNWEGKTDKMLEPISHLDNCNFNHYALQLSLYMYMILKHNRNLKPGRMRILHILFEKEGEDEFGYPIIKYDFTGEPIVKEVIPYEVPYLKKEVQAMIKYFQMNPNIKNK